MENFVPYELAVKLKEKGFREKCLTYYDVEDNVGLLYNTQYTDDMFPCQYADLLQSHNTDTTVAQPDDSENCCDAPTISQVLKWLRERKGWIIVVRLYSTNGWYWFIQDKNGELKASHLASCDDCFATYELAALAGIEYVIDNLI